MLDDTSAHAANRRPVAMRHAVHSWTFCPRHPMLNRRSAGMYSSELLLQHQAVWCSCSQIAMQHARTGRYVIDPRNHRHDSVTWRAKYKVHDTCPVRSSNTPFCTDFPAGRKIPLSPEWQRKAARFSSVEPGGGRRSSPSRPLGLSPPPLPMLPPEDEVRSASVRSASAHLASVLYL